MFKLASLFVEISAKSGVSGALANIHSQLDATGARFSKLGGIAQVALAGVGVAAVGALGYGIYKSIQGAADLGETLSKVDVAFGPAAKGVIAQADEMAKRFGLPKKEVLDGAAALGFLTEAAGQTKEQAAETSIKFTKLAADLSSIQNIPLEEAFGKIRSGLSGEAEPLKQFGVLMTEDAVKAEALRLGLVKNAKELDEQSKVMARASIITNSLAYATGDLENTEGSAKNQFRKLSGTISNLSAEFGTALMPAVSAGVQILNEFASGAAAGFEMVKPYIVGFSEGFANAFRQIKGHIENFGETWKLARLSISQGVINLIEWFGVIPANLAQIAAYIGRNWYQLIVDALNATTTAFKNFVENLTNLGTAIGKFLADPTSGFEFQWKPLLDGFEATAEKLPELIRPHLTSLQDEMAKSATKIQEDIAKKAQVKATVTAPKTAEAAEKASKTKEFKAETIGLADMARKLRGGNADDMPKQQLHALKDGNKTLSEISKKLDNPAKAVFAK